MPKHNSLLLPSNKKQLIINFHALIFHKQTFHLLQINHFLRNSQAKVTGRGYLMGFKNYSKSLAEIPFLYQLWICKVPKWKSLGEVSVRSGLKLSATCTSQHARLTSPWAHPHPFPVYFKPPLARDWVISQAGLAKNIPQHCPWSASLSSTSLGHHPRDRHIPALGTNLFGAQGSSSSAVLLLPLVRWTTNISVYSLFIIRTWLKLKGSKKAI